MDPIFTAWIKEDHDVITQRCLRILECRIDTESQRRASTLYLRMLADALAEFEKGFSQCRDPVDLVDHHDHRRDDDDESLCATWPDSDQSDMEVVGDDASTCDDYWPAEARDLEKEVDDDHWQCDVAKCLLCRNIDLASRGLALWDADQFPFWNGHYIGVV